MSAPSTSEIVMLTSAAPTDGIQEAKQPSQETSVCRPNLFHRWLRLQELESERAVTSCMVSPRSLLAFRFIVALYYTAVLIAALVFYKTTFFSFLTTISSTSLCVYMWVASYHSFMYCRHKNTNSIDSLFWVLKMGFWFHYISLPCFHSLITTTYWIFLYAGFENLPVYFIWVDLSLHAFAIFIVLGEVLLARYQFPVRFWFVPVLLLVLYMFLTWFIHAIWHYWVYSFLGVDLKGM
ncbi:hypothetical protein EMPS_00382 [Entomortierella parvispora]|uniref:Uncharacterized protein n=1 Tax=Entomortierella parvispora TaxID=205924 RepID=A0A9P3LRH4_9FUNG|nr:hypothetical protein EMPS_00382 [Entomortierella parvispora]